MDIQGVLYATTSGVSGLVATDANTAGAVVTRDSSGNFSAGTITASLSGNATSITGNISESQVTSLTADLGACEKTANKGANSGYAGLNSSGQLVGTFITRFDTAANINSIVLAQGELATTTDTLELRVGDGATAGGKSLGTNSAYAVSLRANGTALDNGAALIAAYAVAKGLTPGGAALSVLNRATLLLGPGTYDITGGTNLDFDTPYVDIVGVAGSAATIIYNAATGIGGISLKADNVTIQGIQFYQASQFWVYQCGPGTGASGAATTNAGVCFNDVQFVTPSAVVATLFDSGITSLGGTYNNCSTTNAIKFLGGHSFSGGVTATFTNCNVGSQSLGSGVSSSSYNAVSGTIRNCRHTGNWFGKVAGLFERNYFKASSSNNDAVRAYTGTVIQRNTLVPNGSGLPIGAVSADGAMNIVAGLNLLKYTAGNTGMHANLTNLVATPLNVVDANLS